MLHVVCANASARSCRNRFSTRTSSACAWIKSGLCQSQYTNPLWTINVSSNFPRNCNFPKNAQRNHFLKSYIEICDNLSAFKIDDFCVLLISEYPFF